MKQFTIEITIILAIIALALTSCHETTYTAAMAEEVSGQKKVRVKRYYDHSDTQTPFIGKNIEIITVDTMYHIGDTVLRIDRQLNAKWYVIQP